MAYLDPQDAQPGIGASRSVGAELGAARQRLGWQLADVAASLRIRLPYLEAIEDGRIADLPGHAYATGFVRSYATTLGLDANDVARRFRAEAQHVHRKTELSFPAPVPQRGVPAMAVVLLGIIIAAGAYVGWYRYTGSEATVAAASSAPPERLAALAPTPTTSPQVASILPSSPPLANPVPATPVPLPTPVAVAPPAPLPAAPAVATRVVLHAKTGGWVQVRERQGQVLLNRVLRSGETWPVPMEPQLLLTTSNAGAMELLVDGVAAPSLGPIGAMRRDVPIAIPGATSAGGAEAGATAAPARPAPPAPRPKPKPRPRVHAPATGADAAYVPPTSTTPAAPE